ncbi:MAG: hypothetical protein HY867_00945 [Chloroflexi bacterium]|nr:hypothetical protein [Chloroflexota bacterium]
MKKPTLLVLFVLTLLGSISCQFITRSPLPSSTGTLDLTINYTGSWYRETFNYQPDAQNIRHIAMILPSNVDFNDSPGRVFTTLEFTPSPEPLAFQEVTYAGDPNPYKLLLEYMHDVPQGHATLDLAPGIYQLAVSFIAAALPPPNEDAFLYPGVTGGGASNEFQEIAIEAGKTLTLTIELTDENGWGYVMQLALK